jgi:hypothetical protein
MQQKKYVAVALLLVGLAAIAYGASYIANHLHGSVSSISKSSEGKEFYVAQELSKTCEYGACDIRLLRIDENGTSSVVSENLTSEFRKHLGEEDAGFITIHPFYFPTDGDELVFVTGEGSSKCCALYGFDVSSRSFTDKGRVSDMVGDLASPDNSKVLRMSDDGKELIVSDVLSNTVIATIQAKPGESFTAQIGGYGGDALGEYVWIDYGDGFRYSIFPDEPIMERDTARPFLREEFYFLEPSS